MDTIYALEVIGVVCVAILTPVLAYLLWKRMKERDHP